MAGHAIGELKKPAQNGSANKPISTEPCAPHRTAHSAIGKIS
jgi:hypothetical protein